MLNHILHTGDAAKILKGYEENYFHSIVTDPPYFINAFCQEWDNKDLDITPVFKECMRVLKPGGYLIAFSFPRTYHITIRMVIEARFTIEDMLIWQHEMGFPKSQDIGKKVEAYKLTGKANMRAIKQAACQQAGITYVMDKGGHQRRLQGKPKDQFNAFSNVQAKLEHNNEWSGWYTDIKQTMEPMVLAQKPYAGPAWKCCLDNGVGALNITNASNNHKLAGNIFLCPKPTKAERNAGLDEHTDHPTVKPITLMKQLITLVTPKNGIVLDPFMGSGSTGIAALLLNNQFVGIDIEQKYVDIAQKRIHHFTHHSDEAQKRKQDEFINSITRF